MYHSTRLKKFKLGVFYILYNVLLIKDRDLSDAFYFNQSDTYNGLNTLLY